MSSDKQRPPVSQEALRFALLQSMARGTMRKRQALAELTLADGLQKERNSSPQRSLWKAAFDGDQEPSTGELLLIIQGLAQHIEQLDTALRGVILRGAEIDSDHNSNLLLLASLTGVDGFLGELESVLGSAQPASTMVAEPKGLAQESSPAARHGLFARFYLWLGERLGILPR